MFIYILHFIGLIPTKRSLSLFFFILLASRIVNNNWVLIFVWGHDAFILLRVFQRQAVVGHQLPVGAPSVGRQDSSYWRDSNLELLGILMFYLIGFAWTIIRSTNSNTKLLVPRQNWWWLQKYQDRALLTWSPVSPRSVATVSTLCNLYSRTKAYNLFYIRRSPSISAWGTSNSCRGLTTSQQTVMNGNPDSPCPFAACDRLLLAFGHDIFLELFWGTSKHKCIISLIVFYLLQIYRCLSLRRLHGNLFAAICLICLV